MSFGKNIKKCFTKVSARRYTSFQLAEKTLCIGNQLPEPAEVW